VDSKFIGWSRGMRPKKADSRDVMKLIHQEKQEKEIKSTSVNII
jgi:hypothetical protein